jgi:hypothetical protein
MSRFHGRDVIPDAIDNQPLLGRIDDSALAEGYEEPTCRRTQACVSPLRRQRTIRENAATFKFTTNEFESDGQAPEESGGAPSV